MKRQLGRLPRSHRSLTILESYTAAQSSWPKHFCFNNAAQGPTSGCLSPRTSSNPLPVASGITTMTHSSPTPETPPSPTPTSGSSSTFRDLYKSRLRFKTSIQDFVSRPNYLLVIGSLQHPVPGSGGTYVAACPTYRPINCMYAYSHATSATQLSSESVNKLL